MNTKKENLINAINAILDDIVYVVDKNDNFTETSDGKIIQKYRVQFGQVSSSGKSLVLNFDKAMPDTNYVVATAISTTGAAYNTAQVAIVARTTNSITLNVDIVNGNSSIPACAVDVLIQG